jgi:putative acetyltransferase
MPDFFIKAASTPADFEQAAALFAEYAAGLDIDLSFQNFEAELRSLEAQYRPPTGALLLAHYGDKLAGCVAVRQFDGAIAELKRMYVRPAFRGSGLGRQLLEHAIAAARELGYAALRLDTLPDMQAAIALYREFGFREIEPYRFNPVGGTLYFELDLLTP